MFQQKFNLLIVLLVLLKFKEAYSYQNTSNIFLEFNTWQPNNNPFSLKTSKFKYNDPECGQQFKNIKNSRIVGGSPALLGEFPWLAHFVYDSLDESTTWLCSGSLIRPQFILTAAHCVNNVNAMDLAVVLGDFDKSTDPDCDIKTHECAEPVQVIDVESFIIHPAYKTFTRNPAPAWMVNDIAIVKLAWETTYTKYVQPICLLSYDLWAPYTLWGAGWGITDTSKWTSPSKKMKAILPLVDHRNCKLRFVPDLNEKQICAGGDRYINICFGDSGGPLMAKIKNRWYVVGIMSMGQLPCETRTPAVYTKVKSYLGWINSFLEI